MLDGTELRVRIWRRKRVPWQSDSMMRGRKMGWLLAAPGLVAMVIFAVGFGRLALWQVVRVCVADFKLTGAPFPCLEVNLSSGEEGGDVVLRPPLTNDIILAPTRGVSGTEGLVSGVARCAQLFRRGLASAILSRKRRPTPARSRRGRACRQLRSRSKPRPAPRSCGLPPPIDAARHRGRRPPCADRRMAAT